MPVIDARHLDDISETALLTLHQRATEAARPDAIIDDPMAIALRNDIDYPYHHFGRTHQATALRALAFDNSTRDFLQTRPAPPWSHWRRGCRPVSGVSTMVS
ncbi:leucine carboxyl methyltransferase family protein [Mycobacterium ulcerans str. Harvey]|uniref:Leucine carboxyl methyltransferase family protein n=1 Tax=Mycobacterium ulcerans str. Harvey TaxID=1299332 RepID=A0ABN0QM74_MYCUL|nr:leucine carboxyl methyltransferase family protein [Mycobacterium ulcerans str. Harvey]